MQFGGRPKPGGDARALAEGRWIERGRPQKAHPHPPVQRPPHLAGPGAPEAGRGGVRGLRLAGGPER